MRKWFIALVGATLSPLAAAVPFAYSLNGNSSVEWVDVATNNDAPFGSVPFASDSLAVSPTGDLYSADGFGVVWNLAGPFPAGPTQRTQVGDLDWANNGLWGYANGTSELFFFDLTSSSVTYAQTITIPNSAVVTGVAHHVATGDVFVSANTGLNADLLYHIPAFSSTANLVGAMSHGDSGSYVSDIDFDASGTLYAMTWFHRHFYSVSLVNGAATFVSAGPHRDATGMALDPVPEPATIIGLAAGLALLRQRGRRTRT